MTLEQIKAALAEDPTIIDRLDKSDIGKAIRRKQVDKESLAYLYTKAERWVIHEYILRRAHFNLKDLAKMPELLKAILDTDQWYLMFDMMEEFFESAADLVSTIKENFGLNLDLPAEELDRVYAAMTEKDRVKLYQFLGTFAEGGDADFINKVKGSREVYLDAFEQMLKLMRYHSYNAYTTGEPHTWRDYLVEINRNDIWTADFDILKRYVEKYIEKKEDRVLAVISLMTGRMTFNKEDVFCFRDTKQFFDALKFIKDCVGEDYPFNPECENIQRRKSFINHAIRSLVSNYHKMSLELKEYVLYEYIEPLIDHPFFIQRYGGDYYSTSSLMPAYFLLKGPERLEDSYFYVANKSKNHLEKAVGAIKEVCSYHEGFYPTANIMNHLIINNKVNWENIVIPKNQLYNVRFYESLVEQYGTKGMVFGEGYQTNLYFANKLVPQDLPEEFFEKFGEHIDWGAMSINANMSLEFVKANRDKLNFSRFCDLVVERLDEEMVLWMIEQIKSGERSDWDGMKRMMYKVKGISEEFGVRHMDYVYTSECRKVSFGLTNPTLAQMVAYL